MKRIILATRNRGKIGEIKALFAGSGIEWIGLDNVPGAPDIIEDGTTFRENALKKAKTVHAHTGLPVLSEDSGLEVDALDGAPGIHSARYASPDATDGENIAKLIAALDGVPVKKRTAQFTSVVCLYDGREALFFEGCVEGHIRSGAEGSAGFGYDPVFVPEGYERTFAELGATIKNAISHRARAIAKLKEYLTGSTSPKGGNAEP